MIRINPGSVLITPILLFAALCTTAFGKIIYVDDDAAGANDGSSWENAYVYLQDALADANSAEKPVEIRVAQGIYKPDQGNNEKRGDQRASFRLINEVAIKGGFAGLGEPDPNAHNIVAYETILSGDLNSDNIYINDPGNLYSVPNRYDNSEIVVIGNDTDASAVLDGLTITGGYISVIPYRLGGGPIGGAGMLISSGSPTLINCTFTDNVTSNTGGGLLIYGDSNPTLSNCKFMRNYAESGGGIFSKVNNSLILVNCTFSDNYALHKGGGMYIYEGNPKLTNCTFVRNSAPPSFGSTNKGGGMYTSKGNPVLTNCTFSDNMSDQGGAIYNDEGSNSILTECTFLDNYADHYGGAVYNGAEYNNYTDSNLMLTQCVFKQNSASQGGAMKVYCPTLLTNCTFTGNSATWDGGAISVAIGIFDNCIFTGNRAIGDERSSGGAVHIIRGAPLGTTIEFSKCTFNKNWAELGCAISRSSTTYVNNCIFWGSEDQICVDNSYQFLMDYSDIQGGWPGEGNIDADPCFADPGYWADADDTNIVVEPNDPNAVWIDGDYHLKSEAGRWDPVSESWVVDDVTSPCIDAGDPNNPVGNEPEPNGGRINMGAYGGTAEASMSPVSAEQIVYVQWLGHSTVKVWTDDCIVYVDPERVPESLHDATLVCVTHTHGDHYSPSDIAKVSNAETQFIGPPDVIQQYGSGLSIAPGQTMEFDFVNIKAVPAYNINKSNHPKSSNWVGYIIELGGKRIYIAGDTDLIEEMKSLGDVDVAFLPAGGTYTMNATEAAEATGYIKPDLAIPYHWGQSVGTLVDAQRFAELAQCPAKVLAVGEMIGSDELPEYSPLVAHWALDETEGDIAYNSVGENHGTLYGEPAWQPAGGKAGGALQLDGIDDYVSTDFVLDPANGSFSVFAWIKSNSPGGVIVSQTDGTGSGETWLSADPLLGKLETGLVPPPAGRFVPQPLVSEFVITDSQWYHIGFVWDGSYRILYADGTEVAKDIAIQDPLKSADGGLYIGAGDTLDAGTFFSGLVDDIRIYNVALTVDEIEALLH